MVPRREFGVRVLVMCGSLVELGTTDGGGVHRPVGTVTFLLADIEGSTRLWGSAPGAMGAAVARHYELLDAAIGCHGGVRLVERGEGEGVVAAFSLASDALAAALDVQRAFGCERWPDGAALKFRVALHTGEAQLRAEGAYVGRAVSRCARLCAIAHGGQVVLARATRDLVLDGLPDGAELADLGVHRLRDLGRPEHVFGLLHPDLPGDFAPLRSLDVLPNNLPGEFTSFVGRRAELAQVGELLGSARLLTLTGAGGCGKTRLALQSAADAIDDYPDGVWWVELASLEDAVLLPTAVIAALGVAEVPGRSPLDVLVGHLHDRSVLLALDNCEHLLAACAELVDALLRGCPSLRILATSRAPLGVPGEVSWRVPSMSLPDEARREPIEALSQSDAVRLFIDRALLVRSDFAITAANAPAVAQICHDLDGIPLAIELAAARVRMLAVEQIARGLGDRFRLLTGGSRMLMPRHQTLEASIDWSHELLSEGERTLLRRVCVFAGGWTLDAAEEVCAGAGMDRYAVLELLTGLVDKSLVSTEEHGAEVRYGLLETVRQYAGARLAAAGEVEAVRNLHLAYVLGVAERAEPEVLGAGRDDPVLRRLEAEMPNLRAALDYAAGTDPQAALRLADALTLFWLFAGRYREGDAAYAKALDAAGEEPTSLRGRVMWGRANLGLYGGAYEITPGWAQAALEIGETCGDLGLQARCYDTLGLMTAFSDPAAARKLLERSADLATQAGDDWCRIDALQLLAWCWIWQDEFDAARPVLDEAYAAATRVGYRWGIAWHWCSLALEALFQARLPKAVELFARTVAVCAEIGESVTSGLANCFFAGIQLLGGDTQSARASAEQTLRGVVESGAGMVIGLAYQMLARVELATGEFAAARGHLETAIEIDRLGLAYVLPEHLSILGTVERLEGSLDAARGHGEEAVEIARTVGSGFMQAYAERLLGRVALAAGEPTQAERYLHDALGRLVAKGFEIYIPESLDALAATAAALESFEEAARLLGAAAAGRERLGIVRFPPEPEFWATVELTTRTALGDEAYQAAVAGGAALESEDAVAYARRARGERKRPSRGWKSLTPTELEVVRHVAAGLTNPQIGERMFISRGTVKTHLAHIFAKLAVSSRSELAAEATRRGLGAAAITSQAQR